MQKAFGIEVKVICRDIAALETGLVGALRSDAWPARKVRRPGKQARHLSSARSRSHDSPLLQRSNLDGSVKIVRDCCQWLLANGMHCPDLFTGSAGVDGKVVLELRTGYEAGRRPLKSIDANVSPLTVSARVSLRRRVGPGCVRFWTGWLKAAGGGGRESGLVGGTAPVPSSLRTIPTYFKCTHD